MPEVEQKLYEVFNFFFTAVFFLELLIKLGGLGFKLYFKDIYNQYDAVIVLFSLVDTVYISAVSQSNSSIF